MVYYHYYSLGSTKSLQNLVSQRRELQSISKLSQGSCFFYLIKKTDPISSWNALCCESIKKYKLQEPTSARGLPQELVLHRSVYVLHYNETAIQSNPLSNMLLMCLEYLVGAVSQLLAIHFSPLMTSHPPCDVYRSTSPRRPLSGSIKLLYHIMAVPFVGGITRLAEWQLTLRLNSSVSALEFSSSCKIQ